MLYGYIDESGTPGPANKNEDYFVVGLLLVDATEKSSLESSMSTLANKIKASEIHFVHNSNRTRAKVLDVIASLNFRYIIVAIKKDGSRSHASCSKMAQLIVEEVSKHSNEIHIEMDINAPLHQALSRQFKSHKIKTSIREKRSNSSFGIQVADYLVAISTKNLKGSSKDIPRYHKISKKCLSFIKN